MTKKLTLKLNKGNSLSDVESLILQASQASEEIIEIWLPRTFKATLFLETRICALFSTAARNHTLHIIDWIEQGNIGAIDRFSKNIEGVAALKYAQKIVDAKKNEINISIRDVLDRIEKNEGLIEEDSSFKTMTFCAVDSEIAQQPMAFARCHTKAEFGSEFVARFRRAFRKDYISSDVATSGEPISRLADFVYELFENSFSHGCLDEESNLIPGLRILRMRRHLGKLDDLLQRTPDSKLLGKYFRNIFCNQSNKKFYEISISDQGLGVVDRFQATRPEYIFNANNKESDALKFNEIIEKSLSSKLHQSGTGHGISRALTAINDLKGFISVRFGKEWLVSDFKDDSSGGMLKSIYPEGVESKLAKISGTHINIIIVAD